MYQGGVVERFTSADLGEHGLRGFVLDGGGSTEHVLEVIPLEYGLIDGLSRSEKLE